MPASAAASMPVLEPALLSQVKEPLEAIKPMAAVFDQNYVKRILGTGEEEFEPVTSEGVWINSGDNVPSAEADYILSADRAGV